MNRMWSVLIGPYLVDTVVPSTSGSRSRCTPWRETSAPEPRCASDLVDLVDEDDAVLLRAGERRGADLVLVDQLGGFLLDQQLHRLGDLQLARLAPRAAELLLNMPRSCSVISSMPGGPMISSCLLRLGDVDLDLLVVQLAFAQLLAEHLARRAVAGRFLAARRRDQRVQHAVLGGVLGARAHLAHLRHAGLLDGHLGQVADDRVDVLADVADLGELGRLHLDEGRIGQLGQAPRDLGLADAGGADHQDVLGRDLVAQLLVHLLAAPAVAQRDGHRALGVLLADDVAIELRDDLLRRHRAHSSTSIVWFMLV
jgi:hypothetical protein